MTFEKGSKHSPETRKKMSESHRGIPHSKEHREKISAARKGKKLNKKYDRQCPCGSQFKTASYSAIYCSIKCRRASYGHGLVHAPEFLVFAKQCAICGSRNRLVGDHDHKTWKPRGILCRSCNLAIGNMSDNPALLRNAAEYLDRT